MMMDQTEYSSFLEAEGEKVLRMRMMARGGIKLIKINTRSLHQNPIPDTYSMSVFVDPNGQSIKQSTERRKKEEGRKGRKKERRDKP